MVTEVNQMVTTPSLIEIAMLVVTTLYLVATFGIFLANRKMANAAQDQIQIARLTSDLTRKVELFGIRQRFFDEVENYIEHLKNSWQNDIYMDKFMNSYSDFHILALFDQEILDFWKYLVKMDAKINMLRGDHEYAEKKGDCNGRNPQMILDEIDSGFKDLTIRFVDIKKTALDKFLRL